MRYYAVRAPQWLQPGSAVGCWGHHTPSLFERFGQPIQLGECAHIRSVGGISRLRHCVLQLIAGTT